MLTLLKKLAHEQQLSEDPNTKVAAIIFDDDSNIVASGHNRFPKGVTNLPWSRPIKYHLVLHAEITAIHDCHIEDRSKLNMLITDAPCEDCLKHIIDSGIKHVFYLNPTIMLTRSTIIQREALRLLLTNSDVKVHNFNTGRSYLSELSEVV